MRSQGLTHRAFFTTCHQSSQPFFQEMELIERALTANTKLGPLVKGLSHDDLQQIATNAWRMEVDEGQQARTGRGWRIVALMLHVDVSGSAGSAGCNQKPFLKDEDSSSRWFSKDLSRQTTSTLSPRVTLKSSRMERRLVQGHIHVQHGAHKGNTKVLELLG